MAIAVVSRVQAGSATPSTFVDSPARAHAAGNTLVVLVASNFSGAASDSTITDTAGNTYAKSASFFQNGVCVQEQWHSTTGLGHATNVVRATFVSNNAYNNITVYEISGLALNPVASASTGSATSTNITTGTLTRSGEAIIVAQMQSGWAAITGGTGFTLVNFAVTGDSNPYFADEYKIVTADEPATASTAGAQLYRISGVAYAAAEPTRFYFPSTTPHPLVGGTPVDHASWQTVGAGFVRRKLVTTKQGTAMASQVVTTTTVFPEFTIYRQYISDPIAAQTLSPSGLWRVKGQMRGMESATLANATLAIAIRVYSGDGTTLRGEMTGLIASDAINTTAELATTTTNGQFQDASENKSPALAEVVASAGDRIVVEVGVRDETSNAPQITLSFGDDSATDLAEDTTTTAANNPWIEFSQKIVFQQGIAFDATAEGAASGTGLTYAHTVGTGADRLLVVLIRTTSSANVTGVTYNGDAMTSCGTPVLNSVSHRLSLYYLLNPDSGTNNVVMTTDGAGNAKQAVSVSYTGVKQSAQPDSYITKDDVVSSPDYSLNITTIADNAWALMLATTGGTQTATGIAVSRNEHATITLHMYDTDGPVTPAGTYAMGIDYTGSATQHTLAAVSFAPAVTALYRTGDLDQTLGAATVTADGEVEPLEERLGTFDQTLGEATVVSAGTVAWQPKAIWELTALTTPALEDLLAAVDDPSGSPITKKLALSAFAALTVSNVVIQVKTVGSGTYTPTTGMKKVLVIGVGGGGGGAGGVNTDSAGGGGGAGGTCVRLLTAAQIGASKAYVVGAGGATTPTAGTATTLDGGTLLNAGGGAVGTAGAQAAALGTAAGGAGGTAANGDLNMPGQGGDAGVVFSGTEGAGGRGGNSVFGHGAKPGGTGLVGVTGGAYGGGGSGGHAASAADRAGGAGGNGILFFLEFIG